MTGTDPVPVAFVHIGEEVHRRMPEVARAMTDLIIEKELPLGGADILDILASSVEGNLETISQLLRNGIPVDEARPSTAAIRYAHRLAERGIPADQLRRAYHLGSEGGRREIFGIIRDMDCPSRDKLEILHHMDGFLHSYIDWMSGEILTAYETEARRIRDYSASATASLIREVLTGTEVADRAFEHTAQYRLDQRHRAAVLWIDQANPAVDYTSQLATQVRRIARGAGFAGPTLFTAVDRGTVWVWFSVRDADPVAGAAGLLAGMPAARIAFGAPESGREGFRRSHRQALAAERVARTAVVEDPVPLSYDDPGVALATLLTSDMPEIRRWVAEELGGLAEQNPTAARLWETYSRFLETGSSYTRTGEAMTLHRNTVKYRISQAQGLLPERPQRTTAELSMALRLCALLGAAVLTAAPGDR